MTDTSRFAGKVALVTGAASGIGETAARAFAAEGAAVAVVDRDEAGAERVAQAIVGAGGSATGIAADVSDPAACEAMVAQAVARFGRLDIAFNNAGISGMNGATFEDTATADWDRAMAVNVNGVFYCMKAEVPAMRAGGGGAIVNAASSASFMAVPGMAAYIAGKHAVAGLTKAAALDLIGYGIRVNGICPGMTATPMMGPLVEDGEARAGLEAMIPIGRMAPPQEIVAGVLFLASDAARYAVGTLLRIDGGLTLG